MSILRITLGKKIAFFCLPKVFCDPKIYQKCVFGRYSAPDPAGGAHDALQIPESAGEGTPLPDLTPLSAFGASIVAPLALATCAPLKPGAPAALWLATRPEM